MNGSSDSPFVAYGDEFHAVLGSEPRLVKVVETDAPEGPVYVDGLKVDADRRVNAFAFSGVQVFNPLGDLISEIYLPGAVNFTFGGPDNNILYITTDTAIWAAVLQATGITGHEQMLGKVDEVLTEWESPEPLLGMTHAEMAQHSLDIWLQSEDLPDPNNRIRLNVNNEIVFHFERNNFEAHQELTEKLESLLGYIGCHEHLIPVDFYLGHQLPYNLAPEMGTMKFGTDPKTSVLDTYCRPHDLENVFVTDGSFFVSAGAVNPRLTIIAQTLRVADFIKNEVLL